MSRKKATSTTTKPKSEPNEVGRPSIEFTKETWAELNKMAQILCTKNEMADWLGCSEDTLERKIKEKYDVNFAAWYGKYSVGGKKSLRRVQYEKAVRDGNVPMLIWLGKQILGQSEKVDATNTNANTNFVVERPDKNK